MRLNKLEIIPLHGKWVSVGPVCSGGSTTGGPETGAPWPFREDLKSSTAILIGAALCLVQFLRRSQQEPLLLLGAVRHTRKTSRLERLVKPSLSSPTQAGCIRYPRRVRSTNLLRSKYSQSFPLQGCGM